MPEGFLLIDKPSGMTSHAVVNCVRKATGITRVGHAGTLDPFATGLLIIGVGRDYTKRLGEFSGLQKTYIATAHLGKTSTTLDRDGDISDTVSTTLPHCEVVSEVLKSFLGTSEQIVPQHSAKKVQGKKLYEYAHAGKPVPIRTTAITVHDIHLDAYELPLVAFTVTCSSGTYVRAIARDLGEKLGCGAYLTELRRIAIGTYSIDDAIPLESLDRR